MSLLWLGALSHARAREVLAAAFRSKYGRDGKLTELQYAQSVSIGEGYYGSGEYKNRVTGESIVNSNNWGAAQCGSRPPCPTGCFEATDTHEGGAPYQACFRRYATPEQGAEAYLGTLYGGRRSGVLALAARGDYRGAVAEQRKTGYFELPEDQYWSRVDENVDRVAAALHEPRGDHGSVRLIARAREILPYALAIGAAGAAAYYLFPRETRRLARQGRAMVGL
jgi:hypothetical protein